MFISMCDIYCSKSIVVGFLGNSSLGFLGNSSLGGYRHYNSISKPRGYYTLLNSFIYNRQTTQETYELPPTQDYFLNYNYSMMLFMRDIHCSSIIVVRFHRNSSPSMAVSTIVQSLNPENTDVVRLGPDSGRNPTAIRRYRGRQCCDHWCSTWSCCRELYWEFS